MVLSRGGYFGVGSNWRELGFFGWAGVKFGWVDLHVKGYRVLIIDYFISSFAVDMKLQSAKSRGQSEKLINGPHPYLALPYAPCPMLYAEIRNSWGWNINFYLFSTLLEILLKPVHPFRYIFQWVGIGKSEIAFAIGAKIDTGCYADPGIFQDIEG